MVHIKYNGTIDRAQLPTLEEELIDIARASGWRYEIIAENFQTLTLKAKTSRISRSLADAVPPPDMSQEVTTVKSSDVFMEGLAIYIDESVEPFRIAFDKNGRICTIASFMSDKQTDVGHRIVVKKYEFVYYPYIKVNTFAAETHKKIVKLLDYLKKRYMPDMRLTDSSFYWETRDEEALKVRLYKASKTAKRRGTNF